MRSSLLSRLLLSSIALVAITACPKAPPVKKAAPDTVYVYTSLYPEVIEAIRPAVDAQLVKAAPGFRVEWVQGGSSRLRRQLDRELKSGSRADILLTSDPSHYLALAKKGLLVPYESPHAAKLPAEARAPDNAWVTARYSAMVIGVVPGRTKPSSFEDLAKKVREGGVSIGDPDFSGTNLVTVARLSSRLGWEYYEALRSRRAVVAGGNAMVLERLETATTDAGIVLLENVLAAKARKANIDVVYPKEGAIVVPGPIALLPRAKDSAPARAVYDAILSPKVQGLLVEKGWLYAADPAADPPAGAPKLLDLLKGASLASVFEPVADPAAVREKFEALFAREAITATPAATPAPSASPSPTPGP